jgi:hypothetical protein
VWFVSARWNILLYGYSISMGLACMFFSSFFWVKGVLKNIMRPLINIKIEKNNEYLSDFLLVVRLVSFLCLIAFSKQMRLAGSDKNGLLVCIGVHRKIKKERGHNCFVEVYHFRVRSIFAAFVSF